ncbi:MAG: MFS transporter [Acidobacteria bacterium]|nr:MFS transporter [Acidobacteriota bacterium]MCA1649743.1 MFS transporter [Acidobacteriota bacterium]
MNKVSIQDLTPRAGGYYRWAVCALLFFAATINYIDRQVIGILKPTLQAQFGWSELDYGDIVFAFQLAYAIGFLIAGRMMDRLGTKLGFAVAITVWSVAAAAHAEAETFGGAAAALLALGGMTYSASVAGFIVARMALGLGEAGNFPGAIKTVADWFPRRERAFATGLFNSGTNVGALVTPIAVPWITYQYGWYWAFVATGALGFVWLVFWWWLYETPEKHPRVSAQELAWIRSDPQEPTRNLPWSALLPHRQTWAFAIGKFMTDPIWWLYLFWMPDFLNRNFGVDLKSMGLPLVVLYLVADVGSIGGGWLSSFLIRKGWTVNAARKTAMLTCALAVVPIIFAATVQSMWLAVGLVSIAAAAHQGWSANLYTLVSDTFPRQAVGSVIGFGGMAGAVGGMLIAKVTAYLLEFTGSYVTVFFVAGSAYLLALAVIQALVPRLEPVKLD